MKKFLRIRKAATKSSSLMARPLSPNPPPPSSLMADGKLEIWKKRLKKKLFFFLMAQSLLRITFFWGFPK